MPASVDNEFEHDRRQRWQKHRCRYALALCPCLDNAAIARDDYNESDITGLRAALRIDLDDDLALVQSYLPHAPGAQTPVVLLDARALAESLGCPFLELPIMPAVDAFTATLAAGSTLATASFASMVLHLRFMSRPWCGAPFRP